MYLIIYFKCSHAYLWDYKLITRVINLPKIDEVIHSKKKITYIIIFSLAFFFTLKKILTTLTFLSSLNKTIKVQTTIKMSPNNIKNSPKKQQNLAQMFV